MILSMIRYIKGYVKIRVSGYSPERFINACRYRNIYLWGLLPRKGAYEMYTTIQGFKKLKPIIRKTGTKVSVIGRFGLPFFFHRYRKRKLFFIGALGSVAMIYVMSLFIWNIDVTGNISRSDETLLEFLEENHVNHGMLKSQIDCSRIVKDIRKQYDDIIWVSASIRGTRLIIQIKENETLEKEKLLEENVGEGDSSAETTDGICTDIIANKDCIITEIITRKGTPLVKVGDTVKKGDVLVSGAVEVMNDSQEVIGYQTQKSQADIRGQMEYDYEDRYPLLYEQKNYINVTKEEMYIRFKDRLFWLGSKKNRFSESEKILEENQLCIGAHFKLPFYYGSRITQPYETEEISYTENELQEILSNNFKKSCEDLEKKGVEIIENSVKIYTERNFAMAKGTLTIICDIGEEQEAKVPDVSMEDDVDGND